MLKRASGHWRVIASVLAAGAALALYLSCEKKLWTYNPLFYHEVTKNYDQTFYIQSAADFASHTPGLVPRSRMPLYPWLLHWFWKDGPVEKVLPDYMRFNIALSVVCLGAIFFMLRPWMGTWLAVLTMLVTAFRVFIFKAILVQPEILFYTLNLGMFLLLLHLLRRPSWKLALVGGALGGVTHLTKGSAFMMFAIFVGLSAIRAVQGWFQRRREGHSAWNGNMLQPLAFAAGFLLITAEYLIHSQREYGSAFYDPNTRYYFWAESAEEMTALQHLGLAVWKPVFTPHHLDDELVMAYLKKWAPEEALQKKITALAKSGQNVILEGEYDVLPSARHWLERHRRSEIFERIWNGLVGEISFIGHGKMNEREVRASKHFFHRLPPFNLQAASNSLVGHNSAHPDGYWYYLDFLIIALALLGLLAFMYQRSLMVRAVRENWAGIAFALASLSVSLLAYAWWGQVSFRNRYFLSLYLPLLFCLGVACRFCAQQVPWAVDIPARGRSWRVGTNTTFLLVYTFLCVTDFDDPLNHGNLRDPGNYAALIAQ